ncbi:MAG: penicillin-binding protein activator LpoB [Desulfobulbaceae bacterium]|nr:penicillin-binding protein activator LpoB [Desulfobulbaceae bacterium]
MKKIKYFLLVLVIVCLAGCSTKSPVSFTREDVTLDFVKKVCVMPLENHSEEKFAAELARNVINTQILEMGLFDIVDKGIVDSVRYEEAVEPGTPLSAHALQRLGQRLNVNAIIVGSVDLAGEKRVGSVIVPEISLTLRLIEIKSGLILWQASGYNDGDSMLGRLFGLTPGDTYQVALELVRNILHTIPQSFDDSIVEVEPKK